jgi:hypothetical protein
MSVLLKKIILTQVLIFSYSSLIFAQFEAGDGSEEDPYQVATVEQLQEISENLTAHFIQIADIDARSTTGWNEGSGFNPIGWFSGVYDGNNFSIDSLFINRPEENEIGLFSRSIDGFIRNTNLTNVNITGNATVGGLVGWNKGEITNSSVSGKVQGERTVGGISGSNFENTLISQVYANVAISATGSTSGGISGSNSGIIRNSYSSGYINSNDNTKGGFVGGNYSGTIEYSYTSAIVSRNGGTVGGFIGTDNEGIYKDNYFNNETTGQNFPIGGFTKSEHIKGLPDFEMLQQSSFKNWDFEATWTALNSDTLSYPYLKENPQTFTPGFSFVADFDTVAQNSTNTTSVEIFNPLDEIVAINSFRIVSETSWRWSDGAPDDFSFEDNLTGIINANDSKTFSIEWTSDSQEEDLKIVLQLVTDSETYNKNYSKITLKGVVRSEAGEGELLITNPKSAQRFLVSDTLNMSASVGINNIQENDICWSSDLDGDLGCGDKIEAAPLSSGNHTITVSAEGMEKTETIRVFEDLWELYQSKPADSEIQAIQNDFNIEYWDLEDGTDSWDNYRFHFDFSSPEPSKLKIIAVLDVLKRQQFTKTPVFIKDHNTIYDWFKDVVHTINLELDCGFISGGSGRMAIPRTYSYWEPVYSSEERCGEPFDNYQNDFPTPYLGMLGVLMHEARHSEPEDPKHYSCPGGRDGDEYLENGGGYAWNALYSMWVYKFSEHDPAFIREDYPGGNARSIAINQLGVICGEGEPKHSEQYIQDIIDELLNVETTIDEPEDIPLSFSLAQNHPNPFNPTTNISFTIPRNSNVSLKVFDILGREVAVLIDERMRPGNHVVTFDATNVSSGVYLYRLKAGEKVLDKQMLLIK